MYVRVSKSNLVNSVSAEHGMVQNCVHLIVIKCGKFTTGKMQNDFAVLFCILPIVYGCW